jgi:hypothetical protein
MAMLRGLLKTFVYGAVLLVLPWLFKGRKERIREGVQEQVAAEHHFKRQVIQGWLIVCGISVALVLYGLFALFTVGDKGPPDWDFGSIEDTPGQSVYSTFPYGEGTGEPEPQHVLERPPGVEKDEIERGRTGK